MRRFRYNAGGMSANSCLLICLAFATLSSSAPGGGYLTLSTSSGNPASKWDDSTTISLNLDLGPLGTLTNSAADTLARNAMSKWTTTELPTCNLKITQGSDLSTDHAGTSGSVADNPAFYDGSPDGINPVIYDQFGYLTDAALGAGQSSVVIGFAGARWLTGGFTTILEGRAVINGKFIDGAGSPTDLTSNDIEGVMIHELGHMLNLDHASAGEAMALNDPISPNQDGFPTMYPLRHSHMQTLEPDDIAWICNLYPTASFLTRTSISGLVQASGGSLLNGVNIVARNANDPTEYITCVSGYRDASPSSINGSANEAEYLIPGLPASSKWVLDCEQIQSSFVGGSSVGTVDPPLTLPGPPEFLNEPGVEGNSDSVLRTTTFQTPSTGGASLSGINLRLNSNSSQGVSEVDDGASFPGDAQLLAPTPGIRMTVTGDCSSTEPGANLSIVSGGSDPIEDWYSITPPAGLEVTRISLVPTTDMVLVVASWLEASSSFAAHLILNSGGAGQAETVERLYDTANFGTGLGTGSLFLGISNRNSEPLGTYSLHIDCAVSDYSALVVAGTPDGSIDPTSGSIVLNGRGFSNQGGGPTVTFSAPGIQVNSVSVNSSTQLVANVTRLSGFVPGSPCNVEVVNSGSAGSYAGRIYSISTVPVSVSRIEAE